MSKSRFQGISLDSFLQMIQMDKTSCTLRIEASSGADGILYIINGELVDAECGDIGGPEAALELVSWRDINFEFENICDDRPRLINMPLMHLLMEGLKRRDDREAGIIPQIQFQKKKPEKLPVSEIADKNEPVPEVEWSEKPETAFSGMDIDEFQPIDFSRTPFKDNAVEPEISDTTPLTVIRHKSRKTLFAAAASIIFIIAGGLVYFFFFSGDQTERIFSRTVSEIDNTDDFTQKNYLLQKFIKDYEGTPAAEKASSKLQDVKLEAAKKDLELLDSEIKKLAFDDSFMEKAGLIYGNYLKTNRESPVASDIKIRITSLREMYDDGLFAKIQTAPDDNYEARAQLTADYIAKFPSGKNTAKARAILADIEPEFYSSIDPLINKCTETSDYVPCAERLETYRKIFGNDSRKYEMEALIARMAGSKDLIELRKKAEALGNNLDAIKKLYNDYLKTNFNAETRREIKFYLDETEQAIEERKDWETSKAYALNKAYPVSERAGRIESFIARKPSSIHIPEARKILAGLGRKNTKDAAAYAETQTREEARTAENQNTKLPAGSASSANIARAWSTISQSTGSRFKNNNDGTTTDSMTGKMWCIADSENALGQCLNYSDAKKYVKAISTGGYNDWRLPAAAELYTIYKNAPAMPATGAEWYWTKDALWQGINEVVKIVRPGMANEIKDELKPIKDCGCVRAIRN